MQIHLMLSDDWELRGNGSGNMRALQFATIRRLMEIYERYGLRGTFNVEVMQQLCHLDFGRRFAELRALAGEWEATVREVVSRGHDVQLHLHPQWLEARYEDGRWRLGNRWAIVDFPATTVRQMVWRAKSYLEALVRPLAPDYRCVSFRSGAWSIAPSPHVLPILAEAGIELDTSLAGGLHFDLPNVKLDYRNLDEPLLPFYPRMDDARRVAQEPTPIVCLATHSCRKSLWTSMLRQLGRRCPRWFGARFRAPCMTPVVDGGVAANYEEDHWKEKSSKTGKEAPIRVRVSDLSALNYLDARRALADGRRRLQRTAHVCLPMIFENHTKDIGDFAPIERFAQFVAGSSVFKVRTAAEVAKALRDGVYFVRHDGPRDPQMIHDARRLDLWTFRQQAPTVNVNLRPGTRSGSREPRLPVPAARPGQDS